MVDMRGPDECWPWKAFTVVGGYGMFAIGTKETRMITRASRVAWAIHNGDIPPGKFVLHSCDNGGCCNPRHLRLGNAGENVQDMLDRDRHIAGGWERYMKTSGSKNGRALLNEDIVREIRADTTSTTYALAKKYGIGWTTMDLLRRGKTWRNVR